MSSTAQSALFQIAGLLEKMNSTDKDFRFMAANDLIIELGKEAVVLDDDLERKITRMILKLLQDKNAEVQNLAVKCLGPLVIKVKEPHVESVVGSLCENMLSKEEQLRDISGIGLKTVIQELPMSSKPLVASVSKLITSRLIAALSDGEISVKLEALEILCDLLSRFGTLLNIYHESITKVLLPLLNSSRQAVRKRSIMALSNIVTCCTESLLTKIIESLLERLGRKDEPIEDVRTYVQCVGILCSHAGHRFGHFIEPVFGAILKFAQVEGDDELHEYCLHAFEAMVNRCPKEITPFIQDITDICLLLITHDPNYSYDNGSDVEMMEAGQNGGSGDEGEEEDDEYSDDDDMTWKVRRAAARCLESVTSTRRELLAHMYKNVAGKILARFKEREENVKSDIIHVYTSLIRQTKYYSMSQKSSDPNEETPVTLLQQQIPAIVRAVQGQLKDRSIKIRQDCLALLKELVMVIPTALSDHLAAIMPGLQCSMGEKTVHSNIKIDTLSFLLCLLKTHPAHIFCPFMDVIVQPVIAAINDSFYKIISEGLQVLQQIVRVIRPFDGSLKFDFTIYLQDVFKCTLIRFKTADIDQEVKEHSISCMGHIIASFGDYLESDLNKCLPIFVERLKNEITRLAAVNAINKIASSPLKINLSCIMNEMVALLGSFLRKNQRALKLSTLMLLDTLVKNYSPLLNIPAFNSALEELCPLIDDSDLHITHLTLNLITSVASKMPHALANSTKIIHQVLNLAKSPLLQGVALTSTLNFFRTLVDANLPGMGYQELLQELVNLAGQSSLTRKSMHSLAKCIAALSLTLKQQSLQVVRSCMSDITSKKPDNQLTFSLLVIAEIGRNTDLSDEPSVESTLMTAMGNNSEDVKSAASYALGSIAIGNLPKYLEFILREIEVYPKMQYLILHSLKEVIVGLSTSGEAVEQLSPFVEAIWNQLQSHNASPEEGVRNVVAECLGKLTLVQPETLLPRLQQSLVSSSPLVRTTVLTAMKFTISDQPQKIDPLLKSSFGEFMRTLEDSDLDVRRVALVAFNSALHNKPSLVKDLMDSVLPKLYAETYVKKELIRQVEMGPFTHTVDDGLEIRKAAFECMYTMLESGIDHFDVFEFLNHLEEGLKDHYDIKMLTYLMLTRLSNLAPAALLQRLDRLLEPLKVTCYHKIKVNSVKQEYEKQDELKRCALRAITALKDIPDADKNPTLNEFFLRLKDNSELSALYGTVQKDGSSSVGQDQPNSNKMEVN